MGSEYTFQHLPDFLRAFERFLRGASDRNRTADRAWVAHRQAFRDPGVAHGGVSAQQDGELNFARVGFPECGQTGSIER